MLVFPNIKINIGLRVLDKREDGYHNLETIFYPVQVCDLLEIIKAPAFSVNTTGLPINAAQPNLVEKAWHLIKEKYPELPGLQVYLHKLIPMGAGLGGGSSDAAFFIKAVNELFSLKMLQQDLLDLALQLGSDCPFFILNKPCLAFGRGEILHPVEIDLAGKWIVLINAAIHVSTGSAFNALSKDREKHQVFDDNDFVMPGDDMWQNTFINHFETPVFSINPLLATIKNNLVNAGAFYAAMSGSGSTMYGLFHEEPVVTALKIEPGWWFKKLKL